MVQLQKEKRGNKGTEFPYLTCFLGSLSQRINDQHQSLFSYWLIKTHFEGCGLSSGVECLARLYNALGVSLRDSHHTWVSGSCLYSSRRVGQWGATENLQSGGKPYAGKSMLLTRGTPDCKRIMFVCVHAYACVCTDTCLCGFIGLSMPHNALPHLRKTLAPWKRVWS